MSLEVFKDGFRGVQRCLYRCSEVALEMLSEVSSGIVQRCL